MGGPDRIADYFVVSKLDEAELLQPTQVPAEKYTTELNCPPPVLNASATPGDTLFRSVQKDERPLVDVTVCFPRQGEQVPFGFSCIRYTPYKTTSDTNSGVMVGEPVFVCVQYQGDPNSRNKLPIIDIGVVYLDKEKCPPGFTMVSKSPSGIAANLNHGHGGRKVYLVYKRVPRVPSVYELYNNIPLVCDLCIINVSKREEPPLGYVCIRRSTNEGNWTGNKMMFCIRFSAALGMLDINFKAAVTTRFPRQNYKEYGLPDLVPLFCAPKGLQLLRRKSTNVPLPTFFTFVLTQDNGSKVYGACLSIYEPLRPRIVPRLFSEYGKHLRHQLVFNPDNFTLQRMLAIHQVLLEEEERQGTFVEVAARSELIDKNLRRPARIVRSGDSTQRSGSVVKLGDMKDIHHYNIYSPTCICILSHYAFFNEFKQFLMQLYQVLLSPSAIPIERFVGHFMTSLEFPSANGPDIVLKFGSSHAAQAPIVFSRPEVRGLPVCSFDFRTLFRCLSVDNVVLLINLMLNESRIIIHSRFQSILTQVTETLRTFLFPLEWQCVYIPVCPESLLDFVKEAPVAFLVGADSKWAMKTPLPSGIWTVDLNKNNISCTTRYIQTPNVLQGHMDFLIHESTATDPKPAPLLPTKVAQNLQRRLNEAVRKHFDVRTKEMACGTSTFRMNPDTMFQTAPQSESDAKDSVMYFERCVRDAALRMMVELIGSYRKHLVPVKVRPSGSAGLTPLRLHEIFNIKAFVASAPKSEQEFLSALVKTQAFTKFCDERTFSLAGNLGPRFLFFDVAVEMATASPQSKGPTSKAASAYYAPALNALANAHSITSSSSMPSVTTPANMYSTDSLRDYHADSWTRPRKSAVFQRDDSKPVAWPRTSGGKGTGGGKAHHFFPIKSSNQKLRRVSSTIKNRANSIKPPTSGGSGNKAAGLLLDALFGQGDTALGGAYARPRAIVEYEAGGGNESFKRDIVHATALQRERLMDTVMRNRHQLQHDGGRFRRTSSMITPPTYIINSLTKSGFNTELENINVSTHRSTSPESRRHPGMEANTFVYDTFPKFQTNLLQPFEAAVAEDLEKDVSSTKSAYSDLLLPPNVPVKGFVSAQNRAKPRSSSDYEETGNNLLAMPEEEAVVDVSTSIATDSASAITDTHSVHSSTNGQAHTPGPHEGARSIRSQIGSKVRLQQRMSSAHGGARPSTPNTPSEDLDFAALGGGKKGHRRAMTVAAMSNNGRGSTGDSSVTTRKARPLSLKRPSSINNFALAGVRTRDEVRRSTETAVTEYNLAASTDDISPLIGWVLHSLLQVVGVWFACIPSLVVYTPTPRHALLTAFQVMNRAKKQGLPLDEPCYRALLISCGHCGPSFAPDAQRIYKDMTNAGIDPNAITYGIFSGAVTKQSENRRGTRKMIAARRWKKIRVLKDIFIGLLRLKYTVELQRVLNNPVQGSSAVGAVGSRSVDDHKPATLEPAPQPITNGPTNGKVANISPLTSPRNKGLANLSPNGKKQRGPIHMKTCSSLTDANVQEFVAELHRGGSLSASASSVANSASVTTTKSLLVEVGVSTPTKDQASMRGRAGRSFTFTDEELQTIKHQNSRERAETWAGGGGGTADLASTAAPGSSVATDATDGARKPDLLSSPPPEQSAAVQQRRAQVGAVIVIWSLIGCPDCEYKLFDEEIMGGWTEDETFQAVKCPVCEFPVVPKLNFRVVCPQDQLRRLPDGTYERTVSGNLMGDSGEVEGQIEYMSPMMVRRSLEEALDKYGSTVLQRLELKRLVPALYWNILWYCTRLRLPNPLYFDRSLFGGDIRRIVRECVQCGWHGGAVIKEVIRRYGFTTMNIENLVDDQDSVVEANAIAKARRRSHVSHVRRSSTMTSGSLPTEELTATPQNPPAMPGNQPATPSLEIFSTSKFDNDVYMRAAAAAAAATQMNNGGANDRNGGKSHQGSTVPFVTEDGLVSHIESEGEIHLSILLAQMNSPSVLQPQRNILWTLWGNLKMEKRLKDLDPSRYSANDATTASSPLDVVVLLHKLVQNKVLDQAIVLFLRVRMLSHHAPEEDVHTDEEEEEDDEDEDDGFVYDRRAGSVDSSSSFVSVRGRRASLADPRHHVQSGWELFGSSMYLELLALSQIPANLPDVPKVSWDDNEFEMLYDDALKIIPWLDKQLVKAIRSDDNPPSNWALAFRSVYGHLIP